MAADTVIDSCPSPEMPDSRKRPLDGEVENGVTKRSHYGGGDGMFHFKILVPSVAAGAIIGKGGETIAQLQKDAGARVKMSKANDFYPGTTERVCLITGSIDAVMDVLAFIMEKIKEKPDPNAKPAIDFDNKTAAEREKQVKILVPNSTAGMIIGKGGNYIKQIKEDSGAYVQISQKAKDQTLTERCITVIGDIENNQKACQMILAKVIEDPQSGSCLNVSYADVTGPVANFNPTGSPYANTGAGGGSQSGSHQNSMQTNHALSCNSNLTAGMSPGEDGTMMDLNSLSGMMTPGNITLNGGTSLNLSLNLSAASTSGTGGNPSVTTQLLDHIKVTLRGSGFSDQATSEITAAMSTLATYGILGMGLGLTGGLGSGSVGPTSSVGVVGNVQAGGGPGIGQTAGSSFLGGAGLNVTQMDTGVAPTSNSIGGTGVFGPIGTVATSNLGSALGTNTPPQRNAERFGGLPSEAQGFDPFRRQSPTSMGSPLSGPPLPVNNNSFGLGTQQPLSNLRSSPGSGEMKPGDPTKVDLEVSENIIGAILGPGGKSLVEIQHFSGANIQISKKGTFAPGTRNRIVSISGLPNAISTAQYLIEQRISEEEAKRARSSFTGI